MNFAFFLATLAIASPLHAGVVAHYPFDSDFTDASGNSRDGSLTDIGTLENSGITSANGDWKFGGGAMNFSEEKDYVEIPSKTFASGSSYTIAFWAKKAAGDTGSAALWDMVIGQRGAGTDHFIALNDAGGGGGRIGIRWRGTDNSTSRQADFVSAEDTAWHHYAIVAAGTNVTFYRDGDPVSTATDKLTEFILDTIGEAYSSGSDFDFHGQIDEMWIFDEALTAGSVALLESTNTPELSAGFAGFLQKYDGDFTDSSGQGNTGLPSGKAAITTLPGDVVSGSGALSLDGAEGSYLALTTPGEFSATEPWTMTWWARRDELGAGKGMIAGKNDNSSDFIWLNDNFDGLRFRSSTAVTLDFTAPKDFAMRHYALVADGAGNLSLYLDGQFSETLTGDTSISIDSIGDGYTGNNLELNFRGVLDEFRITPATSTAPQIQAIYDAEKPEEEPAPTATRLRVVLIGGQSNADGRAAVSELPSELQSPQADVDFFYKTEGRTASFTTLRPGLSETNGYGPAIALGRHLADLHAGETGTRVALIKYANGGTNLHVQWKPGGDETTTGDGNEYVVFQETVSSGLAALAAAYPGASVELQGMVWMQGEADISGNYSSFYEADLTNFIADIRATYGASLPFVIGKLSSAQTALSASALATVRAAQEAVAAADPRTAIISTDDYGMKSDNLHFNGAGQLSMGRDFQEQTAYYEWMLGKFSPSEIDNGIGEPDFDADGDGRSNRAEFLGGTEPLAAGLFLQADFTTTSGATAGTISYDTAANRTYAVERLEIATGIWQTVLPAISGTGTRVTRDLTTTGSVGLYRVRIELP